MARVCDKMGHGADIFGVVTSSTGWMGGRRSVGGCILLSGSFGSVFFSYVVMGENFEVLQNLYINRGGSFLQTLLVMITRSEGLDVKSVAHGSA